MLDYIQKLLDDAPKEFFKWASTSPSSNYLINVNNSCTKLDPSTAILYHHIVAQLLYLGKITRPDLLLAISFLCTRVQSPDNDDWKKLGRSLRFLRGTKDDKMTLEANGKSSINWWIVVGAGMIAGTGLCINTLFAVITCANSKLCYLCIAMGGETSTINKQFGWNW